MRTMHPQRVLAEAIARIERMIPETEREEVKIDELLTNLLDLARSLPERINILPERVPVHQAPKAQQSEMLKHVMSAWEKENGNPRLSPELRAIADAMEDLDI